MSSYVSNLELPTVAKKFLAAQSIMITTHAKPDGDAFGSVVALTQALRDMGKDVRGLLMGPVPQAFCNLMGYSSVELYDAGDPLPDVELFVVVDTGAWSQLEPMRTLLQDKTDQMLIIDHHLNGDTPAKDKYIDGKAAACCEIIAQVVELVGGERDLLSDVLIAEALYIGIASDTGWFRFSNCRPQTHQLAAKLLSHGVDHAMLYLQCEQAERAEKLKLLGRALASLRFVADETAAIMTLRAEDFRQTGALTEETERFVDIPQVVGSVQMVVLICEPLHEGDPIRASFRSKPGPNAVNVAELAQQFGGGGHARAAGAKMQGDLDEVVEKIASALEAAHNG